MPVVEFTRDVYPYCVGDVVDLTDAEQATIDATAKKRDIEAYKLVETKAADKPAKPADSKAETKTAKK